MVEKELVVEAKRGRIIEAAQKRFAHYGLEKTTMLEIAEDLGISKAALYYYFTDKEAMFKDVILKEQSAFCMQMRSLIDSDSSIDTVLISYIEKRIEYLKTLLNLGKMRYEAYRMNRPLFIELGEIFHKHEKKLINNILHTAAKRKEIIKLDIAEYSDFFVNVLKAIRLYELEKKNLWEEGKIDSEIRRQHLFFTNMFLKSILVK
jgi:TetR/AcrR family transcriptional repressor of mexJK operon